MQIRHAVADASQLLVLPCSLACPLGLMMWRCVLSLTNMLLLPGAAPEITGVFHALTFGMFKKQKTA